MLLLMLFALFDFVVTQVCSLTSCRFCFCWL